MKKRNLTKLAECGKELLDQGVELQAVELYLVMQWHADGRNQISEARLMQILNRKPSPETTWLLDQIRSYAKEKAGGR